MTHSAISQQIWHTQKKLCRYTDKKKISHSRDSLWNGGKKNEREILLMDILLLHVVFAFSLLIRNVVKYFSTDIIQTHTHTHTHTHINYFSAYLILSFKRIIKWMSFLLLDKNRPLIFLILACVWSDYLCNGKYIII